jgi:NAD+--dinitrogen-reductase ADP-D-ribosyltransferase
LGERLADDPHPAAWATTNLVGIPAPVLGGTAFNAQPQPLAIAGARATHRRLFELLDTSVSAAHARDMFAHYMSLCFDLGWPAGPAAGGKTQRRAGYLKILQGWGLDANSPAGAVLKGWVESRFALLPTFHHEPLLAWPSHAWLRYLEEKTGRAQHNNGIWQQLDLLFEFCQWMLARFALLGEEPRSTSQVTLWRGSTRVEEQIVAGSLRARRCTVRLNNLVSFSRTRESAGCFGDWVLEARVPCCKLLYVPGLINTRSLEGEAEVLALGGDYEVVASYAG